MELALKPPNYAYDQQVGVARISEVNEPLTNFQRDKMGVILGNVLAAILVPHFAASAEDERQLHTNWSQTPINFFGNIFSKTDFIGNLG